jgi:hypothetical protein
MQDQSVRMIESSPEKAGVGGLALTAIRSATQHGREGLGEDPVLEV